MWSNLAKFRHFGKSLQVFGKFLMVYFLLGKRLSILWQICYIIGLIFIVASGQILKNNLTIWSHWFHPLLFHSISHQKWKRFSANAPRRNATIFCCYSFLRMWVQIVFIIDHSNRNWQKWPIECNTQTLDCYLQKRAK